MTISPAKGAAKRVELAARERDIGDSHPGRVALFGRLVSCGFAVSSP
jgi:hypothetical protein